MSTQLKNDLLLRALLRQPVERTPAATHQADAQGRLECLGLSPRTASTPGHPVHREWYKMLRRHFSMISAP